MDHVVFYSLEEFCQLVDPTDNCEPKRSIHRNSLLNDRRGLSHAQDVFKRYQIAKTSWELYGDEGPPVGYSVITLESGHGGGIGCRRTFGGIYPDDQRFFCLERTELYLSAPKKQLSLVLRKYWWVSILVLTPEDDYWTVCKKLGI